MTYCTECGRNQRKYKSLCNTCYNRLYRRQVRAGTPKKKRTQNLHAGHLIHYDAKPMGYCRCSKKVLGLRLRYPTSTQGLCFKCYCRYELGWIGYDELERLAL